MREVTGRSTRYVATSGGKRLFGTGRERGTGSPLKPCGE